MRKRSRSLLHGEKNTETCSYVPLVEVKACNSKPCKRDCEMTHWSPWSHCSKKCGGGFKESTRQVLTRRHIVNCMNSFLFAFRFSLLFDNQSTL